MSGDPFSDNNVVGSSRADVAMLREFRKLAPQLAAVTPQQPGGVMVGGFGEVTPSAPGDVLTWDGTTASYGAPTLGSPLELRGLHAWYAADQIAGATDQARLATWPDLSGNGRDATQANTAKQPLYVANAIGGKSAVKFDATRIDALQTAAFTAAPEPCTVILLVQTPATTPSANQYAFEGSGGSARRAIYYSASRYFSMLGQLTTGITKTFPATTVATVVAHFDGAHSVIHTAGLDVAANTGTNQSPTKWSIGARYDQGATFDGLVAEVIVFGRRLSAGEVARVERYLGAKYFQPLAQPGRYYVDAANGNDAYPGTLRSLPVKSLGAVAARHTGRIDPAIVAIRAPQSTPLREQLIWGLNAPLTLEAADGVSPWYLYGSEQFTSGWTTGSGGVYSRSVTGYSTGIQQIRISTLADSDGNWTQLTANTNTPTTPAAGQFGFVPTTGGAGTLYVHLPADANPGSHTLEVAKWDYGIWSRSAALVTTTDARIYVANVACHRTGGTATGDDGNTVTQDSEAWYGGIHGGFAMADGHWTSATYTNCRAIGSTGPDGDGFNIHGETGALVCTITGSEAAYCADEGISAHDFTTCNVSDSHTHHNGSGGGTHVGHAQGTWTNVEIDHNQRTNLGTDSGGFNLLDQAAFALADCNVHDNPHEGIKIFASTGAKFTDGGGNTSGLGSANGLPDNLTA